MWVDYDDILMRREGGVSRADGERDVHTGGGKFGTGGNDYRPKGEQPIRSQATETFVKPWNSTKKRGRSNYRRKRSNF